MWTLSQTINLDSSKLREFADENFKYDENGRKFSKLVENTGGKGEIARYEQFILFTKRFQKTCTAHTTSTHASVQVIPSSKQLTKSIMVVRPEHWAGESCYPIRYNQYWLFYSDV